MSVALLPMLKIHQPQIVLTSMSKKFYIFMLSLISVTTCSAQFKYTVSVKTPKGLPISGVSIKGKNLLYPGITDTAGIYLFETNQDSMLLTFSLTGYNTETEIAKPNIILHVILKNEAIFEDEINVNVYAKKTTITDAAAPVSILNTASLNRSDQTSFVSAVNTVAGLKMDERSPGSYRISIRGNLLRSAFGVRNVKVYLNGIQFTDASGNTYFNSLAVNSINKIQLIKGPGGSMYGAGTGGVMLLENDAEKINRSLQIISGQYGLFDASALYNINNDKTKQGIALSHQKSKGYREHTEMRRDVFSYAITHSLNKKNIINANIIYSDLFYETPGGLTAAQVAVNPRKARPAVGIFRGSVDQKAAIYLKHFYSSVSDEIKLSSYWKNITGAYLSLVKFKNPAIRNFEEKKEIGSGGRSLFEFNKDKYSAAFGGELQYSFINTSTYGNRLGIRDTLQYNDYIKVRQVNIFAQAGMKLPMRFEITAGISYNNFYYGFNRKTLPTETATSNFTPQFIPRISLLKKVADNASVYLSYGKGYSPPTIDEIHASNGEFNGMLNAESGTNYEIGFKSNFYKKVLSVDISYYLFRLQNTIVSRRDASGAEFYLNAGNTKQTGLEYSVTYFPVSNPQGFLSKLKIQALCTNLKANFGEYQQGNVKYTGNQLTGTSPFIFSLLADVQTINGIYSNITYTYTDKIPVNDANTFFAKAYNLLLIKIGLEKYLTQKIKYDLFGTWAKGFNKNYSLGNDLNAAGNRFFNPSAPQAFTVGIKLSSEHKK